MAYKIRTALKLEVLSEGKLRNFRNKVNNKVQFSDEDINLFVCTFGGSKMKIINVNKFLLSLITPGVTCFKFEHDHLAP